jgi:hypothetical protein
MSHESEKTQDSSIGQLLGSKVFAVAPVEELAGTAEAMPSLAADRLYQFAALTAGLFFLVTLL